MYKQQNIKIFTLTLAIINIVALICLDFFNSQIVRLISSGLFLFMFFYFDVKDKLFIAFTSLLFIADILDLYYNSLYIIEAYSVVKTLAFGLLCFSLYKKMKTKKLGNSLSVLFIIVMIINLLIGYITVSGVSGGMTASQLLSIQIYWFFCVVAAALAAKYYFCTESPKAVYIIIFTFLFVFTDLCGFIANFIEVPSFYYGERLLYLLGFFFLSQYLFFDQIKDRIKVS